MKIRVRRSVLKESSLARKLTEYQQEVVDNSTNIVLSGAALNYHDEEHYSHMFDTAEPGSDQYTAILYSLAATNTGFLLEFGKRWKHAIDRDDRLQLIASKLQKVGQFYRVTMTVKLSEYGIKNYKKWR